MLLLSWSAPRLDTGKEVLRVAIELQFLQTAGSWNEIKVLQGFLDKLGDINHADDDGMTLMHYFAMDGLFPAVKQLQELGAKTDRPDKHGLLPVDYAKFGGHIETQRLLSGIEPPTVNMFTAAASNAQRALQRLTTDPNTDIHDRTVDGKTPLHLSAELGKLFATQYLIDAGADLMAQDYDGNTPLDLAIAARHALVVAVLLAAIDINAKDDKGWTALNWAIGSGSQPRVRELLAKGAKIGEGCQNAIEVCLLLNNIDMLHLVLANSEEGINAASSRGDTALLGVSRRGAEGIVDSLLALKADPNIADQRRGYTPLRVAGENNHLSIVKKLIAHGAKLNTIDSIGDTALIRSSFWGRVAIVQVLLEAGADPNLAGAGGMTPLLWAIYWDELDTAEVLLKGGADVNLVNRAGISPLELAARRGSAAMLKLVLTYFDTTSHTGKATVRRALAQAVKRKAIMMQTILLTHLDNPEKELQVARQRHANASQRELDMVILKDAHPIQWLIANDKLAILEDILAQPLDLDASNANDLTPVMQAVWVESPALETVISHGADPNRTSKGDFPPIVAATIFGNKEAVKILLAWRANPNATDKHGFTALMHASERGYFELAELLLLEGANPNIVNNDGDDALAIAEKNGHQAIAKILRQAKGVDQ